MGPELNLSLSSLAYIFYYWTRKFSSNRSVILLVYLGDCPFHHYKSTAEVC